MDVPHDASDLILRVFISDDGGVPLEGLVYDALDLSILDMQTMTLADSDWNSDRLVAGTLTEFIADSIVEISDGWYQYCPRNELLVPGKATMFRIIAGDNKPIPGQINLIGGSTGTSGPHSVTVNVVDDDDDQPIENAAVRIYRTGETGTKATDASGEAEFTVDAATWDVSITATGYAGHTATLVVDGDIASQEYRLTASTIPPSTDPALCNVAVTARSQHGSKIPGATVTARTKSDEALSDAVVVNEITRALTDSDGRAVLALIRSTEFAGDGTYVITVQTQDNCYSFEYVVPDAASASAP